MSVLWYLARVILASVIIATVAEVSRRYPRWGAILLSLPLVSILAFLASWFQHRDLAAISRVARDTLILVPLSLPFFIPLAFAPRLGWGFWPALGAGFAMTTVAILAWLRFSPA
jgi:hypothetical protein